MALRAGARLGVYEIVSPVGAGGMGEVYRAKDIKLGRDVALKILPTSFTSDPERVARFRREAHILAALNHPHIGAIYGLDESNGTQFLVLELVDGENLDERIARGPIPLDEALPIARQIAAALETAHDQGIIHRDLKPANIRLRTDGIVKVLDFGLAKPVMGGAVSADFTRAPTATIGETREGVILGTPAYMSPEQARGSPVDKQSDIWAFGCVLYEMVTGRGAFYGATVPDTMAAVLQREPDWARLPAQTSERIEQLLRRCLQKDRRQRLRDIGDVRLDLEDVPPRVLAGSTRRAHATTLAGAVTATAIATGTVVWLVMRLPSAGLVTPRVMRLSIAPPAAASLILNSGDRAMALSPDGRRLAYVGVPGGQLYVRSVDQVEPTRLGDVGGVRGPFFSPDGQWIGFVATEELEKVAVTGGPSVRLCRLDGTPRGASWRPSGSIVFATANTETGLWEVSEAGGEPRVLTRPDHAKNELDHLWPEVLPGGGAVLFTIRSTMGGTDRLAVLDLRTGEQKVIVQNGSNPHYVSSGHLVYSVGDALRAVAFDLERREVRGTPIPVLTQVQSFAPGHAYFDMARDGTLVYVPSLGHAVPRTLVWVDRRGREEAIPVPSRAYRHPRISPDGTRVAVDVDDEERGIWIWDVHRGTFTPFTFGPSVEQLPVWTPNGRHIVFGSNRAGVMNVFRQAADGSGATERLTESPHDQIPTSISPDGTRLVLNEVLATPDLMMLTLDRGRAATGSGRAEHVEPRRTEPLIQTPNNDQAGEISPDGRWLAYVSYRSGRAEIYLHPFPDVTGGQWRISVGGGKGPLWARNGQELFYADPTGGLMGVRVDRAASWSAGTPMRVLESGYFVGPGEAFRTYDVAPDGKRFLMIKQSELSSETYRSFIVVQNWSEELKVRVPTK